MTLLGLATGFFVWFLTGLGFWITMTGLIGRRFAARPRPANAAARLN